MQQPSRLRQDDWGAGGGLTFVSFRAPTAFGLNVRDPARTFGGGPPLQLLQAGTHLRFKDPADEPSQSPAAPAEFGLGRAQPTRSHVDDWAPAAQPDGAHSPPTAEKLPVATEPQAEEGQPPAEAQAAPKASAQSGANGPPREKRRLPWRTSGSDYGRNSDMAFRRPDEYLPKTNTFTKVFFGHYSIQRTANHKCGIFPVDDCPHFCVVAVVSAAG
eukprot:gene8672-1552_t